MAGYGDRPSYFGDSEFMRDQEEPLLIAENGFYGNRREIGAVNDFCDEPDCNYRFTT